MGDSMDMSIEGTDGECALDDDDEYEYLALPEVDEEYLDDNKADTSQVLNKIPFTKIHDTPVPFESMKRRCFMPGRKVHVKIHDVEHTDTGLFNPNLYVVQLTHGEYQWTIRRRYKHFKALHDSLVLFKAKVAVAVAVPTKTMKQRRKSFAARKQILPKFPKTPEPLVRNDNIDRRKQQLENYLQNILRSPQFRNHIETLKFLEVSHMTFVNGLGAKWREGMIKKRTGGRRIKLKMCGCCPTCHCTVAWNNRWLILKDTFVAYLNPKSGATGDVMLMDKDFSVQCGMFHTGVSHGLLVSNLSRNLLMSCETHRQAEEWYEDIQRALTKNGQDFIQNNRHSSYSPVRENSYVDWFVDAANYMAAVADAIEGAKEEIFITDWWLSPELYLKRPITPNQEWRLDLLLKRKAEQGVRVYVLIFKEMEMALGLNSFYTKQTLVRQHENIRVMRHPDGITLWSHHEKIVCIDQRIAFLGGIDLCYGRWDTKSHRLTDLGKMTMASEDGGLDIIAEEGEDSDALNPNNSRSNEGNVTFGNDSVFKAQDSTFVDISLEGSDVDNDKTEGPHVSYRNISKNGDSGIVVTGDLNFNNNGNGDDAIKRQKQTAERDAKNAQKQISLRNKTVHNITNDYDLEHETEESDIDMGPDYHPERQVENIKAPSESYKVDPDSNGSYDNPGIDSIMQDENSPAHKKARRRRQNRHRTSNGDTSKEEKLKNRLSGHGQLSHHDRNDSSDYSDDDRRNRSGNDGSQGLAGQGHMGVLGDHSNSHNGHSKVQNGSFRGLNGVEVGKHSQNTDLKVVVAGDGRYWKVCDKSGTKSQTPPSEHPGSGDNGQVVDESEITLAVPATEGAVEEKQSNFPVNVPRIEITDTNWTASGKKAKPILRNIDRQRKFDLGGSDDSPSQDKSIEESFRKANQSNADTPHDAEPRDTANTATPPVRRPQSSPTPITRNNHPADTKRPTDRAPTYKKTTHKQDSQTSETSEISLEGVFEGGSQGTDPTSFRAYLSDMQTQPVYPETQPGPQRPASVFGTGPAGIFLKQYIDNNDNRLPASQTTPPRGKKAFRPPKLALGMKYFGKGSKALDTDTANSLADTGGRLPSPPTTESYRRKSLTTATSDLPSFEELTTRPPKPTTPKTKKKIKTYDIKERFRKNKMMSVDVTDDSQPWNDSVADDLSSPSKILNPHEVLEEEGREGEVRLWIGKDYANFIYKDFVDLDKPFTDMVDRKETPRMPWHDIGCMVAGKSARDVGRHFIQRWNYTKLTKQKANTDYPMLLPKSYSKVSLPQWILSECYQVNSQIVRSSCEWSAGIQHVESSIHNAYIDLILKSKHYIYIENQFFVTVMNHDVVENGISKALYERILDAHKKRETFRVYVVMPLLPAFEGELGTNTGTSIQAVTHYNYMSICRGGKSLLEMLTKELTDPFEYISFFGLRTHDRMVNKLATELVYVHSKLMIVDDRSVIMGSANINDRSLLGKRDSEIAIVIEDTKNLITTTFGGQNVQVGKFASDLRKNIFREHLGVSETDPVIDVSDPVSKTFYKGTWLRQASINTSVYEQVFNCMPADKIQSYHQLREYQKETPLVQINPEKAEKLLKKVQGHLVLMPLLFLSKENLGNLTGTKEGLLPQIIWT